MTHQQMVDLALSMNADKAFVLPVSDIPFDPGLHKYCAMNACGQYNRNYACPPTVGDPEAVVQRAKEYSYALIFQTISALEDSYDFEGMQEAEARHSKIAESIAQSIRGDIGRMLYLTAGACTLCKKCAKVDELPCRFPERAISSLEAYCMDVSTLAGKCGMNYINGANTVTYFGAFLFG